MSRGDAEKPAVIGSDAPLSGDANAGIAGRAIDSDLRGGICAGVGDSEIGLRNTSVRSTRFGEPRAGGVAGSARGDAVSRTRTGGDASVGPLPFVSGVRMTALTGARDVMRKGKRDPALGESGADRFGTLSPLSEGARCAPRNTTGAAGAGPDVNAA
jgi:hypothetical protein